MLEVKKLCQCRRHKRWEFDPWVGKIPWSRKWQPTTVFLSGKSQGQRSLAGYSICGQKRVGYDNDQTTRVIPSPRSNGDRIRE